MEAQPTVRNPSAAAALRPVATTRSWKDSEGWETASFFTSALATPSRRASRGASRSGVKPLSREWTGSVTGSHSR